MFAPIISKYGSFSLAPAEIVDSNIYIVVHNVFACLTFSLSAMVKKWCRFAQTNFFHKYFPHWVNVLFLPSQFDIVLIHTDQKSPYPLFTSQHSKFGTFSQSCSNRTFSNCLSHYSLARGWPYRFRSRGTTGSSILDHDLGHLCFGRRIQIIWALWL